MNAKMDEMIAEDIKTLVLKIHLLGVVPRGMGLEVTQAYMIEFDSGRINMRQFLLNFNFMMHAIKLYDKESKEQQMIYRNKKLTSWLKANSEEINAARKALWP